MSIILDIDLGAIPNDGTGDPLRVGGQEINANFAALNADKLETGGYSGNAQDIVNLINSSQLPFIYYRANLTQVGTNAPVIAGALSTFFGTVSISRVSTGTYRLTCTTPDFASSATFQANINRNGAGYRFQRINSNQLNLYTFLSDGTLSDGLLTDNPILILAWAV